MDVDRLNQRLNLAASIGVIVGLFFLVVEINQSNRIASYAAEHSRRNQWIELNTVRIENSDVYAKFQAGVSDLTPAEKANALMTARQFVNSWKDAEAAYDRGLLSDETFETNLKDIAVVFREAPGLIPYFAYLVKEYDMASESSSVSQQLAEEVKKARD